MFEISSFQITISRSRKLGNRLQINRIKKILLNMKFIPNYQPISYRKIIFFLRNSKTSNLTLIVNRTHETNDQGHIWLTLLYGRGMEHKIIK
jgi:hypothetical protein